MQNGTGRRNPPQIEYDAQHESIDELLAVKEPTSCLRRRLSLATRIAHLAGGGIGRDAFILLAVPVVGGYFIRTWLPSSICVSEGKQLLGRWTNVTIRLRLVSIGAVQHHAGQV